VDLPRGQIGRPICQETPVPFDLPSLAWTKDLEPATSAVTVRLTLTAQQSLYGTTEDIVKAVFAAADVFAGGALQHDDMTVLVMKVSPALRQA
jgi:hypothetical protein